MFPRAKGEPFGWTLPTWHVKRSAGMSTTAPSAPQKINLRRPDIMETVQAQVLSHYRSELVERVRAHGGILEADSLTVKLAKEFGFCYGVERAIDLAYAAKKYFSETSPNTPIYLLGEIIHNPEVKRSNPATWASRSFRPSRLMRSCVKIEIPATPSSSRSLRQPKSARAKKSRKKAASPWTPPAAT